MKSFIEGLPKLELHLHLEGAIPLECLWQLIKKYGADQEVKSIQELKERFKYKDFPSFIDTWIWKNNFLREYEDFSLVAQRVAEDLRAQNIVYAEAFYSPGDFERHGLELQRITEAIRVGLDRVSEVKINLVADLIRDFGPEKGEIWFEQIKEVKDLGVVGVGIGGSEHAFPPEPYAAVYKKARQYGFKTSAHAGEAAGPKSVWGAIQTLCVDRIGHGTRAIEDPELVSYLRENQIPVELCPISNLRTGVVANYIDHPVRHYFDQGLLISVSTDDPKMFNNSLTEEFEALQSKFAFEDHEIVQLTKNAIESSWASEEEKIELRSLIAKFTKALAR